MVSLVEPGLLRGVALLLGSLDLCLGGFDLFSGSGYLFLGGICLPFCYGGAPPSEQESDNSADDQCNVANGFAVRNSFWSIWVQPIPKRYRHYRANHYYR